jgi:trehalose 6-phosphate synthase/phosphatase
VEALDQALRMVPAERNARGTRDLAHIQRCTLDEFANRFVTDLKSTQAS